MYFWLILVVALAFGALYVAGLAGGTAEASDEQFQLAYLTIFGAGMILAGTIKLIFRAGGEGLRHVVSWVCVIGIFVTGWAYRDDIRELHERIMGEKVPSVALARSGGEAELRRAWDGHYRADALINGTPMRLLVDTGASMVLLPYESVAKVGLDPEKLSFSVPVTTANGRSTVAPIKIASIQVGDIEVTNVTAAVAQPGRLKMGLLGMSFLDQLNESVFQGDRLILRQDAIAGANERFKRVPNTVNGMFPPSELRDQPQPY